MLKKSLICALAMIILSLCCTVCFAAENGKNINLGNEIMRSIDKTGNSMRNVVSGNIINDAGNMVMDGMNTVENGINDVDNGVRNTVGGTIDNMNNDNRDNNNRSNNDNRDNNNSDMTGMNNGDYNAARTSADQTLNGGINTMTATTWMWIILIVAAVTILAAVWYYATQGNK